MDENQIKLGLKQNELTFFDKGNENIWMEQSKGDDDKHLLLDSTDKKKTTLDDFEMKLSKLMDDRYYVRKDALNELFNTMETVDNLINLNFLDSFYVNLFKGLTEKMYFPDGFFEEEDHEKKYKNLKKKYRIYSEWTDSDPTVIPKQRFYALVNKESPCDLTEIILDEFNRSKLASKEYNFMNSKVLGQGAAGKAFLFNYASKIPLNQRLSVVTKIMDSNNFSLKNGGKFLPLDIIYYTDFPILNNIGIGFNKRYILEKEMLSNYDNKFKYYNTFQTNNNNYPLVSLVVSSDNFSNQTILHMIFENIFTQLRDATGIDLKNYVKQFDAMLCLGRTGTLKDKTDGWLDYIQSFGMSTIDKLKKTLTFTTEAQVSGINMMEVADTDLFNHLFNIHKNYFSKIRTTDDLNQIYSGKYIEEHELIYRLKDETNLSVLNHFLSDMIGQILKGLTVLTHPKYYLIHGDLKSKNIFVRIINKDGKISYIYKIADYDKSSISFNGIRFHNEGNLFVKTILSTFYPKFTTNKVSMTEIYIKNDKGETIRHSIKDVSNIDNLTKVLYYSTDKELIGSSLFYFINNVLDEYINIRTGELKNDKINELFTKMVSNMSSNNFILLIKESFDKLTRVLVETGKIKPNFEGFTGEKNENNLKIIIKNILLYNKQKEFLDNLYNLNGLITRLSLLIPTLEKVEIEQLFVRYLPTPFYQSIDLYTLFLSILQAPLVKVFLDYSLNNQENEIIQQSIFWNSFKELWVNPKDMYIILGYYTYFFKNPILDDNSASINFILDPIKKNDIYLKKNLGEEYYKKVWSDDEWELLNRYLNKDYIEDNITKKSVKLTTGSIISLPQIALKKSCSTYSTYFHRGSKVFLVNKDTGDVVDSLPDVGKTIWAITAGTGELSNEDINREKTRYIKNFFNTLSYYLDYYQLSDEAYNEIFNMKKSGVLAYLDELLTDTKERTERINEIKKEIKKMTESITDITTEIKVINLNYDIIKRYINNKFSNKSQMTLDDIVKTNYYKDIFGNWLNWDYCMKDANEFSNQLKDIFGKDIFTFTKLEETETMERERLERDRLEREQERDQQERDQLERDLQERDRQERDRQERELSTDEIDNVVDRIVISLQNRERDSASIINSELTSLGVDRENILAIINTLNEELLGMSSLQASADGDTIIKTRLTNKLIELIRPHLDHIMNSELRRLRTDDIDSGLRPSSIDDESISSVSDNMGSLERNIGEEIGDTLPITSINGINRTVSFERNNMVSPLQERRSLSRNKYL